MSSRLAEWMQQQLSDAFAPQQLELRDQSQQHAGHSGNPGDEETHFDLFMVSAAFTGLSRIQRHQAVYRVLDAAFARGLHALAMQLETPEEYSARRLSDVDAPNPIQQ